MNARHALHELFIAQTLDDLTQAHELFAHLQHDEDAADTFNVLAWAARELEPERDAHEMSAMEESFGELHFMYALDAQLAAEQHEQEGLPPSNVIAVDFSRVALTRRIVAIAAVMLATLGVGMLLRPADPGAPRVDDFQPRGVASPPTRGLLPTIEVFCLTRSSDGAVQLRGKDEFAFGVVACPRDAEVQFAYTNPSPDAHYAALFGVSESGDLMWYGPSPTTPAARPVQRTMQPRTWGQSIRLGVNHSQGTVKTYAMFSNAPIDHVTLARLVKRHPIKQLHAHAPPPHTLPEGVTLVSLTFDVIEVPQ